MDENSNNQVDENSIDDGQQEQADPVEARFKNLQSEMNRKLENTNAQLEAILQTVQRQMQPPAPPTRPLKDLVLDDPDAFVKQVVSQAAQVADNKIQETVRMSTANQTVISEMQNRYSEFSQPNSEAVQMALAEAAKLPSHLKNTPEGTRLAMMNAVANLGLVPASRKQARQNDDFSLSGTPAAGTRQSARRQDPAKDIDPVTLAFAQELGVDISDPKRLEGLKSAAQRKNWNRYS